MAAAMVNPAFNPAPPEARPTLPRPRLVVVPPAPVVRRRRVVAALVLVAVVVLASLAFSRVATVLGGAPASVPGHRVGPVAYVVQPGDTLWDIARRLQPDGDVRALVGALADANGGTDLRVGQQLAIP
jgi:Tfp pilus assembly protein FimV